MPNTFRILSLDGGGIRGAYTASFLAGVERILVDAGTLEEGESISVFFDLIAGTSTGGIIACALAMGKTAKEVHKMYVDHGPAIFRRRPVSVWQRTKQWFPNRFLRKMGLDADRLHRSLYDSVHLKNAVESVLGQETLNHSKTRLIIPSMRLSLGRQIVFRTPHLPGQIRDRSLSAIDAILATTAAPTYFPPHRIDNEVQPGQYVDGGVWANHPGLIAYVDALRIASECRRENIDPSFAPEDVWMLSIGTGESPSAFDMNAEKAGLFGWAPKLVDTMMTAQSQGTHFMLRHLIPEPRYHRINFVHCGWKLDAVDRLRMLIDMGLCESRNLFSRIPAEFFSWRAVPYSPFEP